LNRYRKNFLKENNIILKNISVKQALIFIGEKL